MRVILKEDVLNLGTIGDLVDVKAGYARNFLIPRAKAVLAGSATARQIEHHKRLLSKRRDELLTSQQALAAKIEAESLELSKQTGEDERIFGSVTKEELAALLAEKGIEVDKKAIVVPDDAKRVGVFTAAVRLHSQVTAQLKFWIVSTRQAKDEASEDGEASEDAQD